jgi:hypothetical protein
VQPDDGHYQAPKDIGVRIEENTLKINNFLLRENTHIASVICTLDLQVCRMWRSNITTTDYLSRHY